ncbi:addiction module antitoxin [bacterium]|jgi:predicted CopG family antitoxin|nr:addiction module antitoxin [bacterium]
MAKKLTITIDNEVYEGLYRVIGAGKISQFIEKLVSPHVLDLDSAYAEMAQIELREKDALEWSESLIEDFDE